MTKLQMNKNMFYFELSSKPDVDILGITSYMWKKKTLKLSSLIMMLWIFNMKLASDLGI